MTDRPGTDGPGTDRPGTDGPGTEDPAACPRLPESGAYLLGVLSPAERADYAAHLAGCADCLREVGQLAGLPGLLSHTPRGHGPDALGSPPAQIAGLPDPVQQAVQAVRRKRSHQRLLSAAALVLVVGAIGGAVVLGRSFATAPAVSGDGPTAGVVPVVMQQVSGAPLTASVAVAEKNWGSAIAMTCRYAGAPPGGSMPVFVLVAVAADGSTQEMARWRVIPDANITVAASTDLKGDKLRALEVRNPAGRVVVRTESV